MIHCAKIITGDAASWHTIDEIAFGPGVFWTVPELTRSAGIQLNKRVSLRRSFEFLNVVAVVRFGLTLTFPRLAAYRAIRGRRVARERRPRPSPLSIHYLSRGSD